MHKAPDDNPPVLQSSSGVPSSPEVEEEDPPEDEAEHSDPFEVVDAPSKYDCACDCAANDEECVSGM